MTKRKLTSTDPQTEFNDKIRNAQSGTHFYHSPSYYYNGGNLDVRKWYVKPAILLAPHLQFPNIKIRCEHSECSGHYKCFQASNDRSNECPAKVSESSGQKYFSSAEIIAKVQCPVIVSSISSRQCFLTYDSGITDEVLTYILNDSLTPKSFEDIQMGLKSFREKCYTNKRMNYECCSVVAHTT